MGEIKDMLISAMEDGMNPSDAEDYVEEVLKSFSKKYMGRQNANRQILNILKGLVEAYPDQRFFQLLVNADIIRTRFSSEGFSVAENEYNTESTETLKRVKNSSILNGEE
jgi:hypothetical protein